MAIKLTHDQENAVITEGNVLVAAAAGSGKTAVLVERVINKLCRKTNPVSADRLLIVTFTNAAAAEMRSRIEKRLNEECRIHPNDAGLIRQKHLLSSAKICTIDSFCIDLVRENFQKAGVSPDFKITDGNSLRPYDEKVMSDIINRYLSENNETFSALLDIIGAEYDDFNFLEFALDLYYDSRIIPFPTNWINSLPDFYKNKRFEKNNPWWDYAFDTAKEIISDARDSLAKAIDLISVNEKALDKYMPVLSLSAEMLATLYNAAESTEWDTLFKALSGFSLPSLPRVNGIGDIPEIAAAKSIYKAISDKSLEKLHRIFYADNTFIDSQFEKIYEPLKLLSVILNEFQENILEEYLKQNTLTFHTTEQLALNLLCEEKDGEVVIKEDASEFLDRYEEVMVDEYQDTNDLQDMLFYVLSNREKKLFVVGDVKQSIYSFRGANPKNFLKKKNRYIPLCNAKENEPQKIILSKNFRCKPQVCDFVNFFFENLMTDKTGEIIYDSEEALDPAAKYPPLDNIPVEFALIDCKGAELKDTITEARYIAKYIKSVMNEGAVIRSGDDTLRPARYSDFTILLRSVKTKAPIMAAELKRLGIPVSYSGESFADSIEISTLLSILKIIDNPQSDIELLSAMMSPVFGFTPEDLADIRAQKNDSNVYSAVIFSSEKGNVKSIKFLKAMEKYRLFAAVNPIQKVISFILHDTGYFDAVAAMPDGNRRRANLLLLCDYAAQYNSNNQGTLTSFVNYIIKQSENGLKSAEGVSNNETVNIMSIHASKGLQFPVCIIAGTASKFNTNEAMENTLYSTDFSIGFKYFDEELKTKCTTVGREVILDRIKAEKLEEELRLLYVAMTRTQDRMLFTAAHSNAEEKISGIKTLLISSDSEITASVFKRTGSYLDWLMLSLLLHPDGKELRGNGTSLLVKPTDSHIKVHYHNWNDFESIETEETENTSDFNPEITDAIKENISYVYPFSEILGLESKASVSALANKAENAKYAFSAKPAFMSKDGISGAGRGTAMHKVMQYFDFSQSDNVESEIERLREWQYITDTQADSINISALKEFFASDIFRRIKASSLVKREMRFLTEIPAQKIAPDLPDNFDNEKIIVQGAVDVCFAEPDGLVILDFKTDRVDNEEALKEAYSEQLNIYSQACEKIFQMPIKEKIIYSFSLSKEILL